MRMHGAAIAGLALSLVASAVGAQETKIGYVNLQRALNESNAGKKARDAFKKDVDKAQAGLKKQKEQLETMKEQLEKKALVMKDEERRNLELDYQRRLRDFERAYKDSRGLNEVIQQLGAREGYTLILENSSSTVLYSSSNADLTDRIIEEYNRR